MSSDEKIIEGGGEGSSHNTPQEITITIMAPSALETTSIDSSALVASVTSQEIQPDSSVLVVPSENVGNIRVTNENKDLIQTVTETHMGSEDLPVISNISSEDTASGTGNSIPVVNKDGGDENVDDEDLGMDHCLVCDIELSGEKIPVFKSLTTSSHRKVSIFLGGIVGQTLTSRKVHSCSLCVGCFGLLNKLDLLEIQVQETKTTLETNFQETLTKHGGRARRKKPAAAKKSDYVFPKIEADDEDQDAIALEMDETFEPRADDLMEEEHDRKEDRELHDEEWEPNEFKKPRAKRDASSSSDPNGQPKRKRGRPRKDAPKKTLVENQIAELDDTTKDVGEENRLSRPGAVKTKSCMYCEEEVPVFQIMSHMEIHEHHQYPCPYCPESMTRMALCRHIQEQHVEWLDHCDICNLRFMNSSNFRRHQESHQYGENVCHTCNVNFGTTTELANHNVIKHSNKSEEKNVCPCNKYYSLRSKFITHVVRFHRGQVEIDGLLWGQNGCLICEICRKKFKKATAFIAHEKTHRNRRLCCPHCPSNYPSLPLLLDHILSHQFGDYECDKCQLKFVSTQRLSLHEEKVHNIVTSKKCEHCSKEFSEIIQLVAHRRKVHPESVEAQKARFSCIECGMKFLMRANLIRHLKMHDREKKSKPHECNICGKTLGSKYSLATHLRTHYSAKFKCSICEKTFISKYTLLDHIKRIHDEYGYGRDKVCTQCGRSFFKKSELDYHMKTHTGERPYICGVCGESYVTASTLRYHIQKHSNMFFLCQVCDAKFKNYVGWSAHVKRVHGVASIKDYTKEYGIMTAVIDKDSALFLVPPVNTNPGNKPQIISKRVDSSVMSDGLSSTSLTVGLEETVVSMPGKEGDIVHVVSYDDLANPLVHTVDAAEASLMPSSAGKSNSPQANTCFQSKDEKGEEAGESSYSQTSDQGRMMISEGWELILSEANEESQVDAGEWESAHIIVPESGEEQHMVLSNEWDGTTDL